MHIAQSEFARGQLTLTVDYKTTEGQRRVTLTFAGDEIGSRNQGTSAPAQDEALTLLTEFVNTATADLKAKRIGWRRV